MDPSPTSPAWGGAQWIGGGDDDLVLYAPYLAIFELSYAVTIPAGSTRAGFVYGANDSRLMDANKNIHRIANPKDGSYISLVLDVAALDARSRRHREAARLPRRLQRPATPASTPVPHVRRFPPTSSTPATRTPSTSSRSAARSG